MRRLFVTLALTVMPAAAPAGGLDGQGVVYTASNAPSGNSVLVFDRGGGGTLSFAKAVPTGGTGTGAGLGSQGAVTLSADGRWLLVVNAGSDDVSVFHANGAELRLASRVASGGRRPVSVAIDRDLVYVLNGGGAAGGTDGIAGFHLDREGGLHPIPGSIQPLSASGTTPSDIEFTPDGRFLVVTEQLTNLIDVFELASEDGAAGPAHFLPSAGATPFGFALDSRGRLFVAEAAGGAPGASSASSYLVTEGGSIEVVSAAVPTTETSACWLVVTENGRWAFTTNTGSGTVSAFGVNNDGRLALRDADGVTATTGAGSAPADAALTLGSAFLYTRNGGNATITGFRVQSDGGLAHVTTVALPAGAVGLAAR